MPFTLPDINEAIAEAIPDREAIVTATRRVTWRELQRRTRQLGNLLSGAGLGCHHERDALAAWESGQDHLALYLYNGHEYLEGMVGAFRARVAPFNVNYRYVEDELLHLLRDASTRAIIYHASFAPRLARVLPRLAPMALLLQVDDGSGELCCPERATTRAYSRRRVTRCRAPGRAKRISTSSTRAARPACRRVFCGGRSTSSSPHSAAACRAVKR